MRKIAPIALIALLAVAFTSCKKDYTCECTGNNVSAKTEKFNATKKDAKAACENLEKASQGLFTCTLK